MTVHLYVHVATVIKEEVTDGVREDRHGSGRKERDEML